MNATYNQTAECNPLGLYSVGEQPVPTPLLLAALVHSYCVIVFGTLGNASVVWCVTTCTRTRLPAKLLLLSVFVPVLVICLATWPIVGEVGIAILTCDPDRISKTVFSIASFVFVVMAQTERISLAVIAGVRAAAVWLPHRPKLGIRGAVVLVVMTCICAVLISLGLMKLTVVGLADGEQIYPSIIILSFLTITLPVVVNVAAYTIIILVIRRNKHNMLAFQQQGQERMPTAMDQATRAVLAVFISNLVFSLPHSVFHLMGKQPVYMSVIFHVIYATHFVVDPLAYIGFNSRCRKKVLSSIRKVMQFMSSPIITSHHQERPIVSRNQQKQQMSITPSQEESSL